MVEYSLLTGSEKHAARRGSRQRALALLALEEYAPIIGIGGDSIGQKADEIRRMGKRSAIQFRKGIRQAAEALRTIEGNSPAEHVAVQDAYASPEADAGEVDQPIVADAVLGLSVPSQSFEGDADVAASDTEMLGTVDVNGERAIKQSGELIELDKAGVNFIRAVLGIEAPRGLTEPQFTAMVDDLAAKAGIIKLRRNAQGVVPDVHERIAALLRGGDRAAAEASSTTSESVAQWRVLLGRRLRESRSLPADHLTQQVVVKYEVPSDKAGTPIPSSNERSIEEEPVHVQLAEKWAEQLSLPDEQKAALRGMLDPNGSDKLSDNKILVAKRFQKILVGEDGKICTFNIERQKLARLYVLFGISYTAQNMKGVFRDPDPLGRRAQAARRQGTVLSFEQMMRFTYEGMEELLAQLKEKQSSQPVKRVSFEGGQIQLI